MKLVAILGHAVLNRRGRFDAVARIVRLSGRWSMADNRDTCICVYPQRSTVGASLAVPRRELG